MGNFSGNPVVSVDYMYMKASEAKTPAAKEKEESLNLRGSPILITKCLATAWVSANVVPVKGDAQREFGDSGRKSKHLGTNVWY